MGRTIWFTRKWFDAPGYGDESLAATWHWLQHLSHEVGHLPQAERFGRTLIGKLRYVSAFAFQYGYRALLLKRDVHDGAPLEIEADRGRWTLRQSIGADPLSHPLVHALHAGDVSAVKEWCAASAGRAAELRRRYVADMRPR